MVDAVASGGCDAGGDLGRADLPLVALDRDRSWGGMDVELTGTSEPMGVLDGMADEAETARLLTHPLAGYYRRLDGQVAGYRVWHEAMHPTRGDAVRARYDVLERAGLITPGQTPHSVLLERRSDFIVYLPPTRLDSRWTADRAVARRRTLRPCQTPCRTARPPSASSVSASWAPRWRGASSRVACRSW